ncbi:glycosyltransferase family 2 protein [Bradyrhizobium lablabi]|uniref:glycosyltransferase family 2 protein n=1 Tax=Bradyrhizobium lablabi TaxID=722472 RepID=UPI001BAB180E|nr:glycosyltransferase family 2 protein [Bradyrhizobium lablabi]MBR0696597.1 glycosyltransferase family 2 protein [Bradyrhizobium lablabi]
MSSLGTVPESAGGPLVTIAIPTFNRAALLRGCIQAALAQTYNNIEVLVSDNASLDDTENVLRQFDDKRLRVLRQETNIGLLPNWNACLAAAGGEYVFFVSDDDRISQWLVERCVGVIGKSRVPIVVALTNCHLASFGQTKPARASRRIGSGLRNGADVLLEFLADEINVAICSVMVRTEALRSRGGFPVNYTHAADVAAWAPLLLEGEVGFVNEACATLNLHDDSETGRLGVAEILGDGWKVASLISRTADERIKIASLRQELKLQAQRCFSRRALRFLAYYRNNGAGLLEVLEFVWRFRSDLMVVDKLSILKFVAIILCPRPMAARLRHLRQSFPQGWRGHQTAVKPG